MCTDLLVRLCGGAMVKENPVRDKVVKFTITLNETFDDGGSVHGECRILKTAENA